MDIPQFKDIIRKVAFVKNYSSLVIPVVIGLVGLLLFIPTGLVNSELGKRITKESVSIGKSVTSLSRSVVSRDQWREEQDYQQAYESDANQAALLAEQSTRRQLLSYRIFPEPKDISTLIFKEFGRKYRGAIKELITRINARDCPTETELQRHLQSSSGSYVRGRASLGRLSQVDSAIADVLCREKAESAFVYANPAVLAGYEFWEGYEYPGMQRAVEDCWYWQLAYWVIEDVIDTIDALNSGSNSVFSSPVKRLLGVSFMVGGDGGGSKQSKQNIYFTRPNYVLYPEDGLAESCTERFSNVDIDIVHFNVVVVVNSQSVMSFMQQLCSAKEHRFAGFLGEAEEPKTFKHNQITILESNIFPIDREDSAHELYRYGEDAVVKLDLICEYIFNKKGYDEIKPPAIKELLKEVEEEEED
ncbi:MAG: hypothetical protein JSV82_09490 [Planctomycetota bacterium]|nr:MAG: hypothetical protein JSV82_09490 [Planctomycetota bacterium]